MEKTLRHGDTVHSILLKGAANPVEAVIDGQEVLCDVERVSPSELIITNGGVQTRVFVARSRTGEIFVQVRGQVFRLSPVEDDFAAGTSDAAASGRLTATMPGRVIKVLIEPGQEVYKNQPVIIMESMKMEITQSAPFDGRVEEVNVQDGQQIDAGAPLVRIEPLGQAENA